MELDYILNGQTHGSLADMLAASDFDPGAARPFLHKNRSWMTLQNGLNDSGEMTFRTVELHNAVATLTLDQWKQIDSTLVPVARQRLQLVREVEAAGLTYNVPGGMGTTVLQYQAVSDTNDAQMNMDAIVDAENDRPLFDLTSMPLPIINKEFSFTARELAVSRRESAGRGAAPWPLDLGNAENAARKIGEFAEKLFIGTGSTYSYGGGTVYGLINFPSRITKTLTAPTAPGWNPNTLVSELSDMVKLANDSGFYGPFTAFYGPNWTPYFDLDYSTAKGDDTVFERVGRTRSINKWVQLDYLNRANFDIVLVQMTSDVIQSVNFMPLTSIQWDTHGGLKKNYKVMLGKVPRFKRTYAGTTGIVHGASV